MTQSIKDIKSELEKLALHYDVELDMVLAGLREGERLRGRYKDWTLQDCYDMKKIYVLIQNGRCKVAYNKLTYLWKESALVPDDLGEMLFNLYFV